MARLPWTLIVQHSCSLFFLFFIFFLFTIFFNFVVVVIVATIVTARGSSVTFKVSLEQSFFTSLSTV